MNKLLISMHTTSVLAVY